jgi:hypothetical protein
MPESTRVPVRVSEKHPEYDHPAATSEEQVEAGAFAEIVTVFQTTVVSET